MPIPSTRSAGLHFVDSRILRSKVGAIFALMAALTLASSSAVAEGCPRFLPDLRASAGSDCDRETRPANYSAPMTMPYLFEDPYITTELQLVGIWHEFPNKSVFQGGDAGVIALQARIALTDRLAFIATKDGVTILRHDNPILPRQTGLMDITAGFKYALVKAENFIFTPAVRIEIPLGGHELFQNEGSGVIIPSASAAWNAGDFHAIGSLGSQIPFDGKKDSTSLFYNLHLGYALHEHFVPFIALNGMHWTGSGDGSATVLTKPLGAVSLSAAQGLLGIGSFEGFDVANLGSAGVTGNDILTMAWGARVPVDEHASLGLVYERVISDREDIFEGRLTAMMTYVF